MDGRRPGSNTLRKGTSLLAFATWLTCASGLRAEAPVLEVSPEQVELLSYLTERWYVQETRHVRLFMADPDRVHPVAVRHLETFVVSTLDSLSAPPAVREGLERDRIRYLLCAHPQEVQLLGGARSEGVTLLDRRSIVTRWLPHDHEVVHMLAHEVIEPGPAQVPPLLQEGLASAWGGQRGLSAEVVLHRGENNLGGSDADLTRLWAYEEFHAYSRELSVSYSVSARFVQYLLARFDTDRFLELYRLLAGEAEEVRTRPVSANILQLEQVFKVAWPDVLDDFELWRRQHPTAFGRTERPPARPADLQTDHDGRRLSVWDEADGSMVVQLEGIDGTPEGLMQWGAPLPRNYRTRLYTGRAQGPLLRFGLRITPQTVELYDYGLDQMVAELREPVAMDALVEDMSRRVTVRLFPRALERVERPYEVELFAFPRVEY